MLRGFTTRNLAMHKQENSGETATETAIKYSLIAVGIAVAIVGAVGLTGTPVKELFKLHANIPIAQ